MVDMATILREQIYSAVRAFTRPVEKRSFTSTASLDINARAAAEP